MESGSAVTREQLHLMVITDILGGAPNGRPADLCGTNSALGYVRGRQDVRTSGV